MRNLLKDYLFWTYPRGSFHYDVMVTLILVFIFLSPLIINYQERPQQAPASAREVLVKSNGPNAFIYEIGAVQLPEAADADIIRAELSKRIQNISGNVQIDRYSAQKDARGRVTKYRVWAHR
jgi:hypothetical protein